MPSSYRLTRPNARDLALSCWVDDDERQSARTSELVLPLHDIVAHSAES